MDLIKFEVKHFDEFNIVTWRVVKNYCYIYRF